MQIETTPPINTSKKNTLSPELLSWPNLFDAEQCKAVIKASPADFIVEEILDIPLTGQGEHLFLKIEKTNVNTEYLARCLSRYLSLKKQQVSFSGLKDRYGVTTQWFSVSGLKQTLADLDAASKEITDSYLNTESGEQIRILEQHFHQKKLKRGAHKKNRFTLLLTDLSGDKAEWERRLDCIREWGVPNYFGPQRFGNQGQNLHNALSWLQDPKLKLDRNKRSIYLSTLRSFLFNQVLAERLKSNSWATWIPCDVMQFQDGNSCFVTSLDEENEIQDRVVQHKLSPTAPLAGLDGLHPEGEALRIEQDVLDQWQEIVQFLCQQKLNGERRKMRLLADELLWNWQNDQTLQLSFCLESGAFATSVLQAIAEITDAHQQHND